ncbi:hypothetical protein [Daejeonella lutea]|uniref:Uncharacterized protein n=1 Tax=Daejeonella lutea TaxID=572036 RepID=A0A1T5A6G6_9SPHI|nr:hypothetical protein [Daejeonella lutea]SKB30516.1 hypothetical protein SAMN05661099_0375 [Daejeonella lutea]
MALKRRRYSKEFVHRKLVFKLRIFLALFFIMLIISIYDVSFSYIAPGKALFAFLIGMVLGYIVGSAANVVWHEEANKVMMKMDIISGVILVLYLIFAIFKRTIFHYWFSGNELSGFVISLSAGIMLGRFVSVRKQIISVLKREDKH